MSLRTRLWSYSVNSIRQSQGIASCMVYPSIFAQRGCIHTDVTKLVDKVKDTNPFFDKYKEKIKKVGGYVYIECVYY